MRKNILFFGGLTYLIGSILLNCLPAYAEFSFSLTPPQCTESSCLSDWLSWGINIFSFVGVVAAIIVITYAGITYTSSGIESANSKSSAMQKIRSGIFGLILIIGMYVILNTINPNLVTLPSISVSPVPSGYASTSTPVQALSCVGYFAGSCKNSCDDNERTLGKADCETGVCCVVVPQ